MPALEFDTLTKNFGSLRALDALSFSVEAGEIFGFVGSNGAGKSTAMRIALGVLAADSGEVRWDGGPLGFEGRRRVGYMPEERGLYPKQQVRDQLVYFGRLHKLSTTVARRRVDDLLERLSLTERAGDKLESLSLGNQQRVQVAASILHRPAGLVLDEPFSGLDPLAVDVMADLLRDEVARGVPLLFSSHQLELVERLCDDLVILAAGRVVAAGSSQELRSAGGILHRLVLGGDAGWVRDWPGVDVRDVDGGSVLIGVTEPGAEQGLLRAALERGPVHEFARVLPRLSDIFREAIR